MDFGWATLLKGRTSAHFHNFGMMPFLIEALEMEQIGMVKVLGATFQNPIWNFVRASCLALLHTR